MDTEQGERIAKARRRTGLPQREFALQIGRSESLISKLEKGYRELNDVRVAHAIAEFSGVRLAWLLGLDDGAEAHQQDGNVDASCEYARAALAVAVGTQHGDIVRRAEAVARAALSTHASAARHLWQDVLAAKATTSKMET